MNGSPSAFCWKSCARLYSPWRRHPFEAFMKFPLFDAPEREPSQFVGFAGNRVDRQSENRSEGSLAAALRDPAVRVLLTRGGRMHLKETESGFDGYFSPDEARTLGAK